MASKTEEQFNVRIIVDTRTGEVWMGFAHRLGAKRKDGSRMWLDCPKTWRRKLKHALNRCDDIWDADLPKQA